jgi:hypothetical protein
MGSIFFVLVLFAFANISVVDLCKERREKRKGRKGRGRRRTKERIRERRNSEREKGESGADVSHL